MKISRVILTMLIASTSMLYADQSSTTQAGSANPAPDPMLPAPTEYRIASFDANSRVWQRDTYVKLPDGHIATQHHSVTELASGMYYQASPQGDWLESKEVIETFPGGAIARQGPTQIIFANNLNSAGAIDVQTSKGLRLRSNILGLAYYDPVTGNTALIAQIQDSTGELIASNQVLYSNAFDGANADVRYTYKRGSFEQDVIVRSQLPSPESFGLSSDSAELEVMTEFIDPPQETIRQKSTDAGSDADQDISWGTTRLGHGKAFDLGAENDLRSRVAVKRHYATVNGRKILLESVPLDNIQASLQKLPQHAAIKSKSKFKTASKQLALPRTPLAQTVTQPMRLADTASASQGYVLDYVQIYLDQGDYVFRADTTYYLSAYNGYNSIKIEGGTVMKYAVGASIDVWDAVTCKTGPYCVAELTGVDDDTVGEPIPGSTGNPTNYYAGMAIYSEYDGATYKYLHINHADCGLLITSNNIVTDCQFLNTFFPVQCYSSPTLQLNNCLFWNVYDVVEDYDATLSVSANNLTIDHAYNLIQSGFSLGITNSLFVCVTNWGGTFTGVTCATNGSAAGTFEVAGAGSHYLPTNSPYLAVGTASIDPALLADLATKTTAAPLIYSNAVIAGGTYSPYARRDVTGTDLGYHYDPLDYCFGRTYAPANLTFTAGTAVAYFDLPQPSGSPYGNSYGLGLTNSGSVTYLGTATAPCAQVRYSTVQEGNGHWKDVGVWSGPAIIGFVAGLGSASYTPSADITVNARFTLFAGHANQSAVGGAYTSDIIYRFTHCIVNSGRVNSWNLTSCLTNCLLLGTITGATDYNSSSAAVYMQNCTMYEGGLYTGHYGGSTWPMKIQNCAFDSVDFTHTADDGESTDPAITYCAYNAFVTNQAHLPMTNIHDVVVMSFNWQTSWFGNFYLTNTSPLINAGYGTAEQWGLYHFTTQTNQVKETNSIVDIGYHSVATDAYGHPIDTNGDGVPDYLEDANGNGAVDGGEISWTNMDVDGDGLPNAWELAHGLNPFSAADALQDPDYDGRNNLQEYQEGTDPQNSADFSHVRLGLWRFDNTNIWAGDAGQMPLQVTNIVGVASWNTNAALIDGVTNAILKYRDVETNENANINLRNGTIRFWFKPDWKSASLAGPGPGVFGRFLELGNYNPAYTNGWWSLYLTPDGNRLVFGSSTNGAGGTNVSAAASFTTNQWYQIVLTYTSTNSVLYFNGQPLTNGAAPTHYPNLAERTNGFTVGSDRAGTNQAKGQFDELETFNYSLTASEISSNYLGALQKDKNGNGMADIWEWSNFGYVGVDPTGDPDGDGISNLEEYQDGTDPHLFATNRLGYWRFNDVPAWRDERGLSPSTAIGLYPVSSWSGDAIKLSAAQNSVLTYPFNRTNHSVIVSFPSGSIRFWFKPNWGSALGTQGQGPGDTIRLLEMGRQTGNTNYGWLGLTVNTLGTQLTLGSETNGLHVDNVSGPISFTPKGWYQIAVTYTATNSILYVNGSLIGTNAIGMTNLPSLAVLQEGLHVGCSWDGAHQANGAFDELETFNYALSPATVAADYAATNGVDSDGDGLSDILENSLGTNPNSADSDCDGLPDAWEVAHGLNPNDPTDATAGMIALYVSGSSIGSTNMLTVVETNLISIYFSSFTNNGYGVPVTGGAVSAGLTNGVWNFCSMGSDYTNNGVALTGAAGNATTAKLFAFIGPCNNPLIIPPTIDQFDPSGPMIEDSYGIEHPTSLTYDDYIANTTPSTSFSLTNYLHLSTAWNPYVMGPGIQPSAGGHSVPASDEESFLLYFFARYFGSCYIPNGIYEDDFRILQAYYSAIFKYYRTQQEDTLGDPLYPFIAPPPPPPHFYFPWVNPVWPTFPTTDSSFINVTVPAVQSQVLEAVVRVEEYAKPLQSYIDGHPGLIQPTNVSPIVFVNSFISPFLAIDNRDYSLAVRQGAIWNYPGGTNSVTESDLEVTGGTNASSGAVLAKMYPAAKRTILVTGLAPGTYDVYLYYFCPSNSAPAMINNVQSLALTSPGGAKYWYGEVPAKYMMAPASVAASLLSSVPPWIIPDTNTYAIELDVDSPAVPDEAHDIQITGLQIVSHTNEVMSSAILQARAGNNAAYLAWQAPAGATNFNIYRAAGSTASWSLLASATNLQYQDTSAVAGTTYYYNVVGIETGSVYEPTSGVASLVPFGCAPPSPPRIDFMNQLQIPADNGAFQITYQMLMTNSDAFDPQGYPLTFYVDSVKSGSLMINGLPFSGGNRTISPTNQVVWIPPTVMAAPGTPAFQVHVFDPINRSQNSVDVLIKQSVKTYLIGWGENSLDQDNFGVGLLGTGQADCIFSNGINDIPYALLNDDIGQPLFQLQNAFGIYPPDPRWHINFNQPYSYGFGNPPRRLLDLDAATSISTFGYRDRGHCAVTADNHLWFWGHADASVVGMPYVTYGTNRISMWDDSSQNPDSYWQLMNMTLLSPVPIFDHQARHEMFDVADAKANLILKTDGSLWSFGAADGEMIGREPDSKDEFTQNAVGTFAMDLGQITFDGNDASGIASAGGENRRVVEINSSLSMDGSTAEMARCADGTVWSWGVMRDEVQIGPDMYGTEFQLSGDTGGEEWLPKRLWTVETNSTSPIHKIVECWNHVVIWREDGSLSEIGYVPKLDPNVWDIGQDWDMPYGMDVRRGVGNTEDFYSSIPIAVTNVPGNIRQVGASPTFAAVLTDAGEVWVWGKWLSDIWSTPHKLPSMVGITKIAMGAQYIIGLDKKGRLWGVGVNNQGAFGFNDISYTIFENQYSSWPLRLNNGVIHTNAVQIPGVENVVDVFTGDFGWASQVYAIGTEVQGKPVGLNAAPQNQAISLSWSNYPAATSYVIYRSLNEDAGYASVGASAQAAYVDQSPPLQNGLTYFYKVSAVINGVETAPSWEVEAAPMPAPAAPASLVASRACHGVKIQWLPPTNSDASPLERYIVFADGAQLAELLPVVTNYYDSRESISSNCIYAVVAYNSAGQSTNLEMLSTNIEDCAPAPIVATNLSLHWLSVTPNDSGNDLATLVWSGPMTNAAWLFNRSEFDTYLGVPWTPVRAGVPATEKISSLIGQLLADTNGLAMGAWLSAQFITGDTTVLSQGTDLASATDIINMLSTSDIVTNTLQALLWQKFTEVETNIFLTNDLAVTDQNTQTNLDNALLRILTDQQAGTNNQLYAYAYQLDYQLKNNAESLDASALNTKLQILTNYLNRVITDPQPVSNIDFFVTAVANGHFDNRANIRPATSNLFNAFPHGSDLVQLKRMLLDDYFQGQYFNRGGNWGDKLTGFRIHYRTLQYYNGGKLTQSFQRDFSLDGVQHDSFDGSQHFDADGYPCGLYKCSWQIPQGALCWASVSAMVDGEESEISDEAGPARALSTTGWDASILAIPGDHQVYLDWDDNADIIGYDVAYSLDPAATNDDYLAWTQISTNLPQNRFWHTGLATNTTYYYRVTANFYDGGAAYKYVSATVVASPSVAETNFVADASAYDSMIQVEWIVPKTNLTDPNVINQTNWEFFLERKNASDSDDGYQAISDVGFGLAYLDTGVVNGRSYNYRVTAFDQVFHRLQAVATVQNGTNTQISPNATNTFTLLTPTPGNGFVDLVWSPIRANQFTIKHSLSPNGPFDVVDTLNVNDAYQSAKNTYRHVGLQNGVMHYYQIAAITPTGFEIDSDIKGAMPLATLAPLPPDQFQGTFVPIGTNATIALSWNTEAGISKYQLFLQNQGSMTSLMGGSGTAYIFTVPPGTPDNTAFRFALRSVNPQGLASDLVTATVTNQILDENPTVISPVILYISGSTNSLMTTGPTNLALSADVNIPGVSQVSFYDGSQLIGTASDAPYQLTWYHAPGGIHLVTASVLVQSDDAATLFGGGASATFNSSIFVLTNTLEPQLSAYQASVTDLQLPAPALPILLSRSYSSRSTDTNGVLGIGWSASWNMGSVKLSTGLAGGWKGIDQASWSTSDRYFISEDVQHYVTVTLPDGQSVEFSVHLDYLPSFAPTFYDLGETIGIDFQPYSENQGSLTGDGMSDLDVNYGGHDWNDSAISLATPAPSQFTYVTPDGTANTFANALADGVTWLLTKTTDRNGNSLNYTYDDNDATKLVAIKNSCGRHVNFNYVDLSTDGNAIAGIEVYDTIGGTNPAVVYVVSNNLLTEVHELVDRSGYGTYLTNSYAYGNDQGVAPADFNRLTEVYDARGVRVLQNLYTTNESGSYSGDVRTQISPGRTNTFQVDENYDLTIHTTSGTNVVTAKVTSDSSGAISGATMPVSGSVPSTTNAVQTSYDSQGNLINQTDANGSTKTYTYDDQNRLVGQSDENGNSTSSELNEFGQPTLSTDANGKQTQYAYDNAGNSTSVKDPSGTVTTSGYDQVASQVSGLFAGGLMIRQGKSAPYVPYTIVTLSYYQNSGPILGDLIGTTETWQDSGGNSIGTQVMTHYTYDANANRTSETKTRKVADTIETIVTTNVYDAQNRVLTTMVSASIGSTVTLVPQTTTMTYNLLGKQATSMDAAGRVTTNVYDFNGNLIETGYPDGTVSRTSYDGFGRQEYVQDRAVASGATTAPATKNTYDASGRVAKVEKLDGVTLTESFADNATDYTGPAGEIKITASGGTVITTSRTFYDVLGRVQFSVDARGAVTENRYDSAGRRTNVLVHTTYYSPTNDAPPSLADAVQSTSYAYDANGNQTAVTDAANHTTTSVYDDANRVKEMDYPLGTGTVSRLTYYDGLGQKIQETDEAGVSTAYTHDFRGLLTSVTSAFGTTQAVTTVYGYDELGNQISQTDAAAHVTIFKYDALNRRIGRTLPGGQGEGYCYDPYTGNLLYQTNFNGVIITNQYDVANRLTSCSASAYVATYAYGPTGLRTNMVDASGTNSYAYDSLSRLTNKVVSWKGGPTNVALNYRYDALGSLTNLWSSTANGVSNAYQYDLLGRLTNVLANGSAAAGYGFDVVGNLQSLRYGNGVTNLYQYDSRNRLTGVIWNSNSTVLASFVYTLGATGNRTALAETVGSNPGRNYNWAYDYLYRLTGETLGGGSYTSPQPITYEFDVVGNRTNRTSNFSVTGISGQTNSFTPNDWLASDGYDPNGNTTNSGTTGSQYDVFNHLTNVNNGAVLIMYDGDGNRMSKKVGSTTTYYLVDDRNPSGYAQVLEEWTSTGTPALSRAYNYGLALVSQRQISGGTVSYYGGDGHGSTRFLLNSTGNITDTYTYDAYGLIIASTGSTPNSYLYCGQQFDSDLKFYYLRARYYKPDSGRFWTMDSYAGNNEDPSSLHKYLYCKANPIDGEDPSGHDDIGGVLGAMDISFSLGAIISPVTSMAKSSVSLPIKDVNDSDIDSQLNSVYGKILAWVKRHDNVPVSKESFSTWEQMMTYNTVDTAYRGGIHNLYHYTGTKYTRLMNKTFIYSDINYLGFGVGYCARGVIGMHAVIREHLWVDYNNFKILGIPFGFGLLPSGNTFAAADTGYDWAEDKFWPSSGPRHGSGL